MTHKFDLTAMGLIGFALSGLATGAVPEFKTDAHVHVVDFLQEGDGLTALLKSMDEHKVQHALISGIAVKKKWSYSEPAKPKYYLSDTSPVYWYSATDERLLIQYQALSQHDQSRLHPFITGFNPTDVNASAEIEFLLNRNPKTWQGIGEIFTRHDDLSALTEGELPRADHPALIKVYKLAAKHDLPVLLHSNLTSKKDKGWLYLEEIENALESSPKTRIILAHAGTSGTLHRWQTYEDLDQLLDRLLAKHSNLYIDLSWSVLDPYITELKTPDIVVNKAKMRKGVSKQWLTLLEKYPDRFTIGSDVVGKYKSQGKLMKEFDRLLRVLTPQTAQKIAHDNFLQLLPKWARPK